MDDIPGRPHDVTPESARPELPLEPARPDFDRDSLRPALERLARRRALARHPAGKRKRAA